MSLYRETGHFTVPLELAMTSISQEYGQPNRTEQEATWSIRNGIGYQYTFTVNQNTGTFTATVTTGIPYWSLVVISISLAVFAIMAGVDLRIISLLGLWNLLLGITPVLPVLPFSPLESFTLDQEIVLEERQPTPHGILPVSVGFACQVAIFQSLLLQLFISAIGVLSILVYAHRIGILTPAASKQFTIVALPAVGIFPLLFTLGNLLALHYLVPIRSNKILFGVIATICVNTILLMWAYGKTCNLGRSAIETIPITPLQTRSTRLFWIGTYAVLLLTVITMAGTVIYYTVPTTIAPLFEYGPKTETFAILNRLSLTGPAQLQTPLIYAILLVLISPALLLFSTWMAHVVRTILSLTQLVRSMTEISSDELGFDPGVPIYKIQSEKPIANALQIPFIESGILLGSRTLNELELNELRAVCAHERHHLKRNDPAFILLSTVLGFFLGGRNVLLALYDFPKAESDADKYAARKVGTEPTIRALRQMESLQRTQFTPDQGLIATAAFQYRQSNSIILSSLSQIFSLRWLQGLQIIILGPYRLFYGDTLTNAAHRSVDERVRELLDRRTQDDNGR